jgi:hypothetical protein
MLHHLRVSISSVVSSRFDPRTAVHSIGLYKQSPPLLKEEAKRKSVEAKEKLSTRDYISYSKF